MPIFDNSTPHIPGDGTLDLDHPESGDDDMPLEEMAQMAHQQNMAALSQTGIVAQNNFVTTTKALDLDFIEGKRMVGLTEAMGVREVASKSVPAGPSSP